MSSPSSNQPPPSSSSSSARKKTATTTPEPAGIKSYLTYDVPASVVVFLVALPLCLGIAVASGAPPLAGLIAGILGGIVVPLISRSPLAVSGPAAGLTAIVVVAIDTHGYQGFLLATCIAGVLQILFGLLRAGIFAYYFPSSVIKGMLAAIGLILILKQIPHALGFDADFEGDLTLFGSGHLGPIDSLTYAFQHVHKGATIIAALGLGVLILYSRVPALKKLKWLPGPLIVVALSIGVNMLFAVIAPELHIKAQEHLVKLPTGSFAELGQNLSFPDFSQWSNTSIWGTAFTVAMVASIETLLCVEAIDKLDPLKRNTPVNRELVAQGAGNMLSGLIGGIPLTAVIVRGSANVQSGARTRLSAFLHGIFLLCAVLFLPKLMNLIPLAGLAAILLHIGYKLADPTLFRNMFKQPINIWAPFVITVIAILLTDLLKGVGVGMVVGVFFILRTNLEMPFSIEKKKPGNNPEHEHMVIQLSGNVSFLNKASVNRAFHKIPNHTSVEIDGSRSHYIHPDVLELISEFEQTAGIRHIEVTLTNIKTD